MPRLLFLLLAILRQSVLHQYLLMEPIQDALKSGNFMRLKPICQERISVNLDQPFDIQGFMDREQFCRDFSERFARYFVENENIEWVSMHVAENLAVESLNIVLIDRHSRKKTVFKLILFMIHEKEWKLYYLRGLNL